MVQQTSSQAHLSWETYALKGLQKWWLKLGHAIPAWPWLRRPTLWLRKPLKAQLQGPVDVSVWGLKLRLWAKGNLSEQRLLFMPQFLDSEERCFLKQVLHPGSTFVDIGANVGVYSLWAGSLGTQVRVSSFEPDPELCERLQGNLDRNALSHVHLHPFALGSTEGQFQLQRGTHNRGENKLIADATTDSEGVMVPVRPLATVLEEDDITSITAMKIDVEGHETEVLSPFFEQTDAALWPLSIICELHRDCVHPDQSEIGALILKHGYRLTRRTRMNGIFTRSSQTPDT